MKLWIILLPSAKNSNFFGFYCVSIAVTNIILYVFDILEDDGIILFYIWLKIYYIHSNNETNKKNYFKKFIEELGFVELSTLTKHLRVWILHDNWLNDSLRYYC